MIYVYAIAENLRDVAALRGILDEPLSVQPYGSAAVVVGEIVERPAIEPATLRAQDALIRELHNRADALLPMRFATTSAGREEMVRSLEAHTDLLSRLAAVRGCEQMTCRVFGPSSPARELETTATTGTEYLLARARRRQPAPALETLARSVRDLVREVRIEEPLQPGVLGSVYHLIARGREDEYRETIKRAAQALADVRVLVTGPSPPYAFA